MSWIFALGLEVDSYWQPWSYLDAVYGPRLGGYYSKLDGLHFATVHGAGHEVTIMGGDDDDDDDDDSGFGGDMGE